MEINREVVPDTHWHLNRYLVNLSQNAYSAEHLPVHLAFITSMYVKNVDKYSIVHKFHIFVQ